MKLHLLGVLLVGALAAYGYGYKGSGSPVVERPYQDSGYGRRYKAYVSSGYATVSDLVEKKGSSRSNRSDL